MPKLCLKQFFEELKTTRWKPPVGIHTIFIQAFTIVLCSGHAVKAQEDSIRLHTYTQYIETALTVGYNHNFGEKVDGKRPATLHFVELGLWRSNVMKGHHPLTITYYFANDIGLNTNDFVIGPKIGGFFSLMVLGIGGEFVYYTDFDSGSLRFIPSMGIFTPYFKLTINPHLTILTLNNKDFQNLNKGQLNLTVRIFKVKRTDNN